MLVCSARAGFESSNILENNKIVDVREEIVNFLGIGLELNDP